MPEGLGAGGGAPLEADGFGGGALAGLGWGFTGACLGVGAGLAGLGFAFPDELPDEGFAGGAFLMGFPAVFLTGFALPLAAERAPLAVVFAIFGSRGPRQLANRDGGRA